LILKFREPHVEPSASRRVAVVRVFIRKTRKAAVREIELALKELASEFALARAVLEARVPAGPTQEQLAQRMALRPNRRTGGTAIRRNSIACLICVGLAPEAARPKNTSGHECANFASLRGPYLP
jgi:hypothetical protein